MSTMKAGKQVLNVWLTY